MHKSKLKSFSYKDIKIFKKRNKKNQAILEKANDDCILQRLSPIRFIDPFQYHRIISDMIIIEDTDKFEEQYFSALKVVISLKHTVTVDFYEEFTYARFQNSSNYPYSSIDLVVYRLRSLGDQKALKMAETISEYKELCLLIKNAKAHGYKKEILNCFAPKYVKFLKDYFVGMMSSSVTTEQMKTYLNETLEKNKRNPVFFIFYDEYKDYIGTQILGIGVNKTMKRLIGGNDFQIFEKEIWCVEGKGYCEYITNILNEYLVYRGVFYQTLFINTKFGYIKITFEVKTLFVVVNNEKRVFTSCVAKEIDSGKNVPLSLIENLYDEKDNEKDSEKEKKNEKEDLISDKDLADCERNKIWNKLIDCYFDFSKKN